MLRPRRLRHNLSEARQFLRAIEVVSDQLPAPPHLPPGRTVNVPNRGEMFLRESPGPNGAPAIVMLHGWTLSADLNWFAGGYETATRHGSLVAPDLRGHGRGLRSEELFTLEAAADDIAALVSHLELAPAILVGYSLGGSVALLAHQRHPEVVAGMVLVATGLQWRASIRDRAVRLTMAGAEYLLRFGAPKGITDRYLRQATVAAPELKPLRGWLKAEARRGDAADIAAAAHALSTFDARPFAAAIDIPTAVVITGQDRLIQAKRQRQLAKAIAGARAVELDAAHNAWLVRPHEFTAALDHAIGYVVEVATTPVDDDRRPAGDC